MNERIDELMIQAGARFEFLHGVHYDDFQYRKFAELIVRECVTKMALEVMNNSWIDDAIKNIYEHFGVER